VSEVKAGPEAAAVRAIVVVVEVQAVSAFVRNVVKRGFIKWGNHARIKNVRNAEPL
jgi:hypothetical protein